MAERPERDDDSAEQSKEQVMRWLETSTDELMLERLGEEVAALEDVSVDDQRLLDWLAPEARERDRVRRLRSDEAFLERGEALVVRALARLLRVQRREEPLLVRDAPAAVAAGSSRLAQLIDLGVAAGVGRALWDEPAEQCVEVPSDLPDADYLALRIVGESMAPLIHSGDTVLVRRGPEFAAGTVIIAQHPDAGYVCKKVSHFSRDEIFLESLNSEWPPITIPRHLGLVVGTVLMLWSKRAYS
jgi:SOS-response transcriptional repressor LexA